LVKNEVGSQ